MSIEIVRTIIQAIVAIGIYNVWIFRFGKSTNWRGGHSTNMQEEFAAYGLSRSIMFIVGTLKILFATLLLLGLFYPELVRPAAFGLAILMLGAIIRHIKIHDSFKKSIPATTVFLLCIFVAYFS